MVEVPEELFYGLREKWGYENPWLVIMDQNDSPVFVMPLQDGEFNYRKEDIHFEGRFENFSLEDLPFKVCTTVNQISRDELARLVHMIRHLIASNSPWSLRALRLGHTRSSEVTIVLETTCLKTYADIYTIWPRTTYDPAHG